MAEEETERKVVIPGEVIVSGDDFLPGEGTEKRGEEVVAIRFGLLEENKNLIKVIPLSGTYTPRRGNTVIGVVENFNFYGWNVDIDSAVSAFLPVAEIPRYVNKDELTDVMDIGDLVVAKIKSTSQKSIDLTTNFKGLGKIDGGIIMRINPNKVPRVIGKEGSMVTVIKENTNCKITVGQNGLIWISGNNVDDEIFAKKAILFIVENSFVHGLTEKVQKWFRENSGDRD